MIIRISKPEITRQALKKAGITKELIMFIKRGNTRILIFKEKLTIQERRKIVNLLNKWNIETIKLENLEPHIKELLKEQLNVFNLTLDDIEV